MNHQKNLSLMCCRLCNEITEGSHESDTDSRACGGAASQPVNQRVGRPGRDALHHRRGLLILSGRSEREALLRLPSDRAAERPPHRTRIP